MMEHLMTRDYVRGANHSLRVVMLLHGYHPLVGGAERQVASVAPALSSRGVDVHVLTRHHPGLDFFEIVDSTPVHRLPSDGSKAMASLRFTRKSLQLIRSLQPEVVHAHTFFSPATIAILAKRMFGIPMVVTAHRSSQLGDVYRLSHKFFGARRMSALKNAADAFVCISREIENELKTAGMPSNRFVSIPNGVDTDEFSPLLPEQKQQMRRMLGLPDGPIAIFTGRLVPEKRVEHLITLWPSIRELHPKASLVVVGTGPMESLLRNASGPGIIFPGNVNNVASFLQASDIFVLPSIAEGLSVALLEAMSTELAVISSAVGGAPDVISDGTNGCLIPSGSKTTLREALLKLLSSNELRRQFGVKARRTILERYSIASVADSMTRLYEQLALSRKTNRNGHSN